MYDLYDMKEALSKFFKSRLFVLFVIMLIIFSSILMRAFTLQIVNGASYQEAFTVYAQRTLNIEAARGNIYDCNGKLLAGNELAYAITLADSGTYESRAQKNPILNEEIATILAELHDNKETLVNNFPISRDKEGNYSFNINGNALKRFRADVFGYSSTDSLKYNEEFGFDESKATAQNVMDYLRYTEENNKGYHVDKKYDDQTSYEIVVVRYELSAYSFARYNSITIAEDVKDETVAYMNEHADELIGVAVEERTTRKYYCGESLAPIIGYTGKISDDEYLKLYKQDESYSSNDTIGKAGLEQYYESQLRGTNGEQDVYVNNVGKITQIISSKESRAGNDLTLTIDADMQEGIYYLLEQEIAGIVYAKIKDGEININDVYYALINNNVIDITHFKDKDAGTQEQRVYEIFEDKLESAIKMVEKQLTSDNPTCNEDMSEEMLDYFTYVVSLLKDRDILQNKKINTNDNIYKKWAKGKISPQEYLSYSISQQWVDISLLNVSEKYSDTNEIYHSLCDYIVSEARNDKAFAKILYKYLINSESVSGKQLCLILFEQGVLDYDDDAFNKISNGSLSPYSFLLDKVNKIEITPAQLALDPCTGSCVLTDTKTGEIKALVSYPGYDNNKMANGVDADYFASMQEDLSKPQYNYATQERTAPGSTFKMVSATAGLAENVISTSSQIKCTGIFKEVDNEPKCWIFPSKHKSLNVSTALRDSCNVFFYTVGYGLSTSGSGVYNDSKGIKKIQKYASIYGLDEKTGLEIEENTPQIATEFPVMAAIGQSDNNYTTVSLSRYVTAVTTGKLYNYQLMKSVTDVDGNVVLSHNSEYEDISGTLTTPQWDSIHNGMRLVCSEHLKDIFDDVNVAVAGKTGTAQQTNKPNHALFVGYAPYENPKVSIAVRIAHGYTSSNAAVVAKNILAFYFGEKSLDDILSVHADSVRSSGASNVTD